MTTWGSHRPGTVYYVLGERGGSPAIKIGMTGQDPCLRARQHKGRLLAAHAGNGATENRLNDRFAHLAVGGEWFRPAVDLLCHIGTLAGDP